MPRQARIDAPGALHHIIARGIGRKKIFNDDIDRLFIHKLACHPGKNGPADDLAVKKIHYRSQVKPSLFGGLI
jgi:hypothetical protein